MFERFKSRSRVAAALPGDRDLGSSTATAERADGVRREDEIRREGTPADHRESTGAATAETRVRDREDEHREHEERRVEREERREDRDADREDRHGGGRTAAAAGGAAAAHRDHREVRARQREEFGGLSWGAAFFGFLVAVGLAVILLAIASAAGAAFGLSKSDVEGSSGSTITLVSGIVLIVVLALAYYAGGYVAGRMSRFDGGRQGFGVWVIGLLITIAAAAAGAILGSEYNVFNSLSLPNIPVDKGSLTTGGAIALGAALLATLLAALIGGKAGERYHKRVDRAGFAE